MRQSPNQLLWWLLLLMLPVACSPPPPPEIGVADYGKLSGAPRCEPGARAGGAGISNNERTPNGITYNIRTPANYDPAIAHPLLVVYAPAGTGPGLSESFTGFTRDATARGFIVAYSAPRPISIPSIIELSAVPGAIAGKWCVDERRIYFSGHSDGGTISNALAFLEQTRELPAAIAPSAMGIREQDMTPYACPAPLSVMVMHSSGDTLFPGFGAGMAAWWARCNGCGATPMKGAADGCDEYPGCAGGVRTIYCEGRGGHISWPNRNGQILDFLAQARRPLKDVSKSKPRK